MLDSLGHVCQQAGVLERKIFTKLSRYHGFAVRGITGESKVMGRPEPFSRTKEAFSTR
jgi:hypothetical protein